MAADGNSCTACSDSNAKCSSDGTLNGCINENKGFSFITADKVCRVCT